MADPVIKIKRSSVAGKIPTTSQLSLGEFAINTTDGKVYIEQESGGVGIGTTIITVNPWTVGPGTNTYNTYFTSGNIGIGTTNPTSKLHINGDLSLDDGGTYFTSIQIVTPTTNRTISFPDATGNVALVSGLPGQLIYNSSGAYIGYTNSGIDTLGNLNLSGGLTNSKNGSASAPPLSLTGTWFSGGTSTTTKPQLLIEPINTTSTAWSINGTGLGINAASGFTGRFLDLQLNGISNFNVDSTGRLSIPLGVSTLPSIYPGTDTNTGLWSPTADTLAISCGGSERMRWEASGNVLVGTTTNSNSSQLVSGGTISETFNNSQWLVVSQADIGTQANQIPLCGMLGQMAFMEEPYQQVASSTADATVVINAAVVDYYCHIASFTAARTIQIDNLTSGQAVTMYIRNTNGTDRTITITASTGTTNHSNVNLAPGAGTMGAASVSTVGLAATSGTTLIWVANINANIVGGILA